MAKKSFKIRNDLAEALSDTIVSARNNAGELHIEIIPIRKISLDPENPRDLSLDFNDLYHGLSKKSKFFERKSKEKKSLESLVNSIHSQGVINPIVVYKHGSEYRLIAGERRTLASILAKKEDVPAKVLTFKPDRLKLSLIQWAENIEREDLTLWERMQNLEKILAAYAETHKKLCSSVTPTEISKLLGCSLQQGVNYRHLLGSSKELKKHIQSGEIKNIEKAALISKSPPEAEELLIKACLSGCTLAELKKLSNNSSSSRLKKTAASSRVSLGFTKNTKVAKAIIDTMLGHADFRYLSSYFTDVRWNDHRSVALAFQKLVKLLEQR